MFVLLSDHVTVNDCANVTLALGASPIMADTSEEIEEIVSIVSALVINIGTPNTRTLHSILLAGKIANQKGIPVVLDPVGVGALTFCNEAIVEILENIDLAVIEANTSEMAFIASGVSHTQGVDASLMNCLLIEEVKYVAKNLNCVCVMTGEVDYIVDEKCVAKIKNGVEKLSAIIGSDYMAVAMIEAFLGSSQNIFLSSVVGVSLNGVAGEVSEQKENGSFRVQIIDMISSVQKHLERIRIEL